MSVSQRGTTHGDSMTPQGFRSNHAGGVLGGISTGQDLEVSIAIKPTSSILSPRESIDMRGEPVEVVTKGRHDPCVGIRATPIAEAMLALVVMDHALRQRAQNADVVPPLNAIAGYVELLLTGCYCPVPPQQQEVLQRVTHAQKHLLGLINDILNFAKLERGRVEYDIEPVPLRDVIG